MGSDDGFGVTEERVGLLNQTLHGSEIVVVRHHPDRDIGGCGSPYAGLEVRHFLNPGALVLKEVAGVEVHLGQLRNEAAEFSQTLSYRNLGQLNGLPASRK